MPLSLEAKRKILARRAMQSIRDMNNITKATARDVLHQLNKAKQEITGILSGAERFSMPYYRSLLADINEKIEVFQDKATGIIHSGQDKAWDQGSNLGVSSLKAINVDPGVPHLSDRLLVSTRNMTADLLVDVGDDMRRDISRSLRRSIMVGDNPFAAARKVDKILGVNKTKGYLNRSDTIVRTELNRTYSMARQAQDEQIVKNVPELRKQWWAAGDGRDPRIRDKNMGGGRGWVSHKAAHGQIQQVKSMFEVGGQKLLFPRDPRGNPENVVKCRCQSIPYLEASAPAKPLQKAPEPARAPEIKPPRAVPEVPAGFEGFASENDYIAAINRSIVNNTMSNKIILQRTLSNERLRNVFNVKEYWRGIKTIEHEVMRGNTAAYYINGNIRAGTKALNSIQNMAHEMTHHIPNVPKMKKMFISHGKTSRAELKKIYVDYLKEVKKEAQRDIARNISPGARKLFIEKIDDALARTPGAFEGAAGEWFKWENIDKGTILKNWGMSGDKVFSEYATHSVSEFAAESLGHYVANPKTLKKKAPAMYKYLEKEFKRMGKKL